MLQFNKEKTKLEDLPKALKGEQRENAFKLIEDLKQEALAKIEEIYTKKINELSQI